MGALQPLIIGRSLEIIGRSLEGFIGSSQKLKAQATESQSLIPIPHSRIRR